MSNNHFLLTATLLMTAALVSAEHDADKLYYLEMESVLDKNYDVVWAYGEEIPRGQVSFAFSGSASAGGFQMSGQCDYAAQFSMVAGSKMELNMDGSYTECANARVKDTLDHWKSNRAVNNAQLYVINTALFGSSWSMIGDKDHAANRILPLVGQHILDHPKFLNEEFANHVEKYGTGGRIIGSRARSAS